VHLASSVSSPADPHWSELWTNTWSIFWKIHIRELEDVFVVADASFLRDSMPVTQTATAAAACSSGGGDRERFKAVRVSKVK